ncbi:uncharacterized protein LOC126605793 isoform X1 [Malus sylvestris]|uniref:uncharacterized protein LOC126605793 isoform X1 n=2 Tax=Malus sylvestris TaxID=3752 RepID=UPI0021ACEC38|nr:uncharacterized protein LOC126605793 isoform X1 [Malus sylvestris]
MLLSSSFTSISFPSPNFNLSRNRSPKRILKMAEAAKNPVGQQQRIIVPNKHGEKLVGLLHETGSADLVILCHGFRDTREHYIMVNLAVALENEGISSFRFDFAGNGCGFLVVRESEGTFQFGNYRREADDLRSVVEYFSGAKRAPSTIVGHSKGGDAVLLYASTYHDIRTVVNISGRYELKKGIEERLGKDFMEVIKKEGFIDVKNKSGDGSYRVTEESLMDRLSTDMHQSCLQIDKECRVVTIHGTADEVIPVEDALEFAKIIHNHKLHLIEGANHSYTSHQAELASLVVDFIKAAPQQDKATSN